MKRHPRSARQEKEVEFGTAARTSRTSSNRGGTESEQAEELVRRLKRAKVTTEQADPRLLVCV
jgi:hypothetical protein